jgi:uncharacterized membrane protein
MRTPFSPLHLLFLVAFALFIIISINLQLMTLTFEKLGLAPGSALLLILSSLFGSLINLPLFTLRATAPPSPIDRLSGGLLRPPRLPFTGYTQVAVNVGGCLVPVMFSFYLIRNSELVPSHIFLATAIVATVSYGMSRPIPGLGIGMPMLVAPLTAALVAIPLGGEYRAPLAYIAGSLGVLIGADVLRLKDIRKLGAPLASIGGAGTFDGIFMTGLVAVLLT